MSKFELGQKVVVTSDVVDMNGNVGTHGEIVGEGLSPNYWRVRVFFKGTQSDIFTLSDDEIYAAASTDGVDVENRDGHIFDMPLTDGGTARAVWLPETNANIRQLFIEQGHSARLHQELEQAKAQLAAAVSALQPFDALWADWFAYCMSGDKEYHTILDWMYGTHTPENVAEWIRIASDKVRAQSGQHDVG
jgi:hypothetical protein